MTIYGRFNKEKKTLEILSDGAYSRGVWEEIENAETATAARMLFFEHKNGMRRPAWTSCAEWVGSY